MWRMLKMINRQLVAAIPAMMLLGFLCGWWQEASALKALILPFTFLMVYPMMVNLDIRKVMEAGDARAQVATQAINFLVIPFLAFGAGRLFFPGEPYMALGLLLAGLVPTSGMTISWTGLARGNVAAAVKMTVIGLTLGSIATPLYVGALLGEAVAVDLPAVFRQIAVIVFLPMAAGYLTRRALVAKFGRLDFQKRLAPRFPALSTIGVLGIVFIAMALKAKTVAAEPLQLVFILAPVSLLYAVNYTLSTLIGRWLLGREEAIALVYGSVMRNLSIALAIAVNAFGAQGSSTALVIALAYIVQVQSAAWYVRLTDRIFGSAAESSHALSPAAGAVMKPAP